MSRRTWTYLLGMLILSFTLYGCSGQFSTDNGGGAFSWDTAVTNSLGEAYLQLAYNSETTAVRDSATDDTISGIQVLGMADEAHRLYVAADPYQHFHPTITSGEPSNYYDSRIYMTPADQHLGTNSTSYTNVDGTLLHEMIWRYGQLDRSIDISALRDRLATLAYGRSAGLVVCLDEPLTSYAGMLSATEVAQRSSNLSDAFQSIGWQYIFTSHGFSTYQSVNIWTIDPYQLGIASGSSGALNNTLIAVVAPTSGSSGDVLPNALKVELTWDAPVDLDLHLVRSGADLYDSNNDCFWQYLEQNWGDPYRVTDNPRLLFDNQDGYGPETIVLDEMSPGEQYTAVVDYWGDPAGNPCSVPTTATVRVWANGNSSPRTFQVSGLNYGAPQNGQYKIVCDIDGSTGDITIANRSLSRAVTRGPITKKK